MKSRTRGISLDKLETDMEDLAGIRIMCPFVEDIHDVVSMLKNRNDLTVVYEKDYVTNKKDSGYRSYHLICEYPVQLIDEVKVVLVEIQIRTLAMNFWASIEHSLNYKYQGEFPEEINTRLQKAAESAFQLDEEMSTIREEIKEIQKNFRYSQE
jgi:putative GTP pyrophosphokinase